MKPIIIDCVENWDSYIIAHHPKYRHYAKGIAPNKIVIFYDHPVPKLPNFLWKLLIKGLLNRKKMIPCTLKHPITGKVYFKFRKGDR